MADLIKLFFSGIFIFNAIPHLIQGICGKEHMTPLSQKSSPWINVIWGWINLVIGCWLYISADMQATINSGAAAFCLGGGLISLFLAIFWSNPNAKLPWHK